MWPRWMRVFRREDSPTEEVRREHILRAAEDEARWLQERLMLLKSERALHQLKDPDSYK